MERVYSYDQTHCWQYDIRLRNLQSDIAQCSLSKEEIDTLAIKDFTFSAYNREPVLTIDGKIDKDGTKRRKQISSIEFAEVKDFIKRHE